MGPMETAATAHDRRSLIETALQRDVRRIPFTPSLEDEYEAATRERRIQSTRAFLLFIGAMNVLCLPLDAVLSARVFEEGLLLRAAIVTPLFAFAYALLGQRIPPRVQGFCVGVPLVALVVCVALIGKVAGEPFASRYLMAAGFAVFACNTAIPFRFPHACLTSLASLGAFAVIVFSGIGGAPGGRSGDLIAFMSFIMAFSLRLNYRLETANRRTFLLNLKDALNTNELVRANEVLTALSQTDSLTGLANRRAFDVVLARAWADAAERRVSIAVIMIDVDHFKLFNDTAGHAKGDRCLQAIARTIGDSVRGRDLAARYGGEEFTVILHDADNDEALRAGIRISEAVRALRLPHPALSTFVTVSAGVAAVRADSPSQSAERLVQAADTALYAAKCAGRDQLISGSLTLTSGLDGLRPFHESRTP